MEFSGQYSPFEQNNKKQKLTGRPSLNHSFNPMKKSEIISTNHYSSTNQMPIYQENKQRNVSPFTK